VRKVTLLWRMWYLASRAEKTSYISEADRADADALAGQVADRLHRGFR